MPPLAWCSRRLTPALSEWGSVGSTPVFPNARSARPFRLCNKTRSLALESFYIKRQGVNGRCGFNPCHLRGTTGHGAFFSLMKLRLVSGTYIASCTGMSRQSHPSLSSRIRVKKQPTHIPNLPTALARVRGGLRHGETHYLRSRESSSGGASRSRTASCVAPSGPRPRPPLSAILLVPFAPTPLTSSTTPPDDTCRSAATQWH